MGQDVSIGCVTGCGRVSAHRGLCDNHYAKALKDVNAGRATWAGMVAAGKAREAQPRIRPPWNRAARPA